jgi:hypothetical protein
MHASSDGTRPRLQTTVHWGNGVPLALPSGENTPNVLPRMRH